MVNYITVLIATLVAFAIGWLWYSVLFGKQWMRLMNFSQKEMKAMKQKSMVLTSLIGLVTTFIMVTVLAYFINALQAKNVGEGMIVAFVTWVGYFATTLLGGVLWENKSLELYILNAAHYLVVLLVAGAMLGMWG